MKLIDKDALVAEIKRLRENQRLYDRHDQGVLDGLHAIEKFLDNLEVKEVKKTEQRMKECHFRQDVCNRYKGTQVKCDGRCSWVVDYPKLKELKVQKGE